MTTIRRAYLVGLICASIGCNSQSNKATQTASTRNVVAISNVAAVTTAGTATENPEIEQLIARVSAVTSNDVIRYAVFVEDPNSINASAYQGALPSTGDAVQELISRGQADAAVTALLHLVDQRMNSGYYSDQLVCSQAIKALGQFGPLAKTAAERLELLEKRQELAIGPTAKVALESITMAGP